MRPSNQSALLIIDVMNHFEFEGGQALARAAMPASRAIARLRDRYDAAGRPVIYANDNWMQWQGEFSDLIAACRAKPGPAAQIADTLQPRKGHFYVLKPKNSAFLASALPVLLVQLGVTALAITGIAADACVLATALDSNMRDYTVWVPGDCTAARDAGAKSRALQLLRSTIHADTRSTRAVGGLFPAT